MKNLIIAIAWCCAAFSAATARPPIEAYGELPDTRSLAISPDGAHAAFLTRRDGSDILAVTTASGAFMRGMRTDRVKARSVGFAGPDHVIIQASETTFIGSASNKYENSGAYSFNIKTDKLVQIPRLTKGGLAPQKGLGRIVGKTPDGKRVFMPAFTAPETGDASYDLYEVELDGGVARIVARGDAGTFDYFVNGGGDVIAREEYKERDKRYRLWARRGAGWTPILERQGEGIPFSIHGLTPDETSFVYTITDAETGVRRAFALSLDGASTRPLFVDANREIDGVLVDDFRRVIGVRYAGATPSYKFFDAELNADMDSVVASREGLSVSLVGWTEDLRTLIVLVEGGFMTPAYLRYDRDTRQLTRLTSRYARIADADVGAVLAIEFKARDGLTIPAIVSMPPGVEPGATPLPAIVMPHGGPEAYDTIGFDWMAQYFANRGHIVIQPNFRGSAGFGEAFRRAGDGEWGGKMQDDISDSLATLARLGWADPKRACIVGGSYGGYAALMGGATTPDLFNCVVAIAPVSDLEQLLREIETETGARSLTYNYIRKLVGDRRKDKEKVRALSPVNLAAQFKAPVLLIHGRDDTVVSFDHSRKMAAALKRAGKPVDFVQLKGEDHWLSQSDTRLETLRSMAKFVETHIGGPK